MASESPDFEIFTSLRYDEILLKCKENATLGLPDGAPSPFYMLRYHRDRMLTAARHFQWNQAAMTLEGDSGLCNLESRLSTAISEYKNLHPSISPLAALRVSSSGFTHRVHFDILCADFVSLFSTTPSDSLMHEAC
jgi:hypothetical protein